MTQLALLLKPKNCNILRFSLIILLQNNDTVTFHFRFENSSINARKWLSSNNLVPETCSRKYTFTNRNRCSTPRKVRTQKSLLPSSIRQVRSVHCCPADHLLSLSQSYILKRREFYWCSMNRPQRNSWVKSFLHGLCASEVC